jgi:hypothetical protein
VGKKRRCRAFRSDNAVGVTGCRRRRWRCYGGQPCSDVDSAGVAIETDEMEIVGGNAPLLELGMPIVAPSEFTVV